MEHSWYLDKIRAKLIFGVDSVQMFYIWILSSEMQQVLLTHARREKWFSAAISIIASVKALIQHIIGAELIVPLIFFPVQNVI